MTHMGKYGAKAGNRIEVNDYSESAQLVGCSDITDITLKTCDKLNVNI